MSDKTNVFVDGEVLEKKSNDEKENENNESEISGKINEFIRLMMDSSTQDMDPDKFADMAMYLAQCYHNHYRHSYYNISAEIYTHWKDGERKEQKLNNLASNVEKLKEIIVNKTHKNDELVKKGIQKFYDHIMLEIVRLVDQQRSIDNLNKIIEDFGHKSESSFHTQEISLAQTVGEFENRFGEAEKRTNDLKKATEKTKKKVKNLYSQFISVLGIFTAIVIVFFGGASIFSDVLINIHQAKWYQIGFSIAFVGLVLFDIIFMLLYILSKFMETPICTKEGSAREFFLVRWIERYPYVFLLVGNDGLRLVHKDII